MAGWRLSRKAPRPKARPGHACRIFPVEKVVFPLRFIINHNLYIVGCSPYTVNKDVRKKLNQKPHRGGGYPRGESKMKIIECYNTNESPLHKLAVEIPVATFRNKQFLHQFLSLRGFDPEKTLVIALWESDNPEATVRIVAVEQEGGRVLNV